MNLVLYFIYLFFYFYWFFYFCHVKYLKLGLADVFNPLKLIGAGTLRFA